MAVDRTAAALLAALMRLRRELGDTALGLDTPSADGARELRGQLVDQLEDYVLPRLVQLDAPLLAVVGGPTGAGKSTLVNTLIGRRVSDAGVLRPTTRSPVLVHNPADAEWFAPERILPEMARTTSPSSDIGTIGLVPADAVPAGLALLDAPDVDSIERGNRALAEQLLAAADLWLFVTSAARYADQVPWEFLRSAAARSTAVAVVLDRAGQDTLAEVRVHLARMLTSRGLRDSPLFSVPEGRTDADGLLEPDAVQPIRDWLAELVGDADVSSAVVRQTLDGAVRRAVFGAHDLADAVAEQVDASRQLRTELDTVYSKAQGQLAEASADGTVLRGDILARWQDFVGTGEVIRSLDAPVGRIRRRVADIVQGRRNRSEQVREALTDGLRLLLVETAESAAEQAERSWSATGPGHGLLTSTGVALGHVAADFGTRAEQAVRAWCDGVHQMVHTRSASHRLNTRLLSVGIDGVAAVVMVEALTAADTAPAADETPAVGRALLEAIFGIEAARDLSRTAHTDLVERFAALLESERDRFADALAMVETGSDEAGAIREAARAVEDARHRELLSSDPEATSDDEAAEVE